MARVRPTLRLVLGLVLVASTQTYGLIGAQFALDREAIAERYCVNRDRPELDCAGSCELSRRMQQQHDEEDERQTALLEVALAAQMWLGPAAAVAPAGDGADAARVPAPGVGAGRAAAADVFEPPRAA